MDLLLASGTVPLARADIAPPTGTPGYATDGDPASLIPPTTWPAYQANAIMQEMLNLIRFGGQTPDRNNNNQMALAVQALIAAETSRASTAEAYTYEQLRQFATKLGLTYDQTNPTQHFSHAAQAMRRLGSGNVSYIAGNTQLTADHMGVVVVDASIGGIALGLPAANTLYAGGFGTAGQFTIVRIDQTNNPVTVQTVNGEWLSNNQHQATSIANGERLEIAAYPGAGLGGTRTGQWYISRLSAPYFLALTGAGANQLVQPPPGIRNLRGMLLGGAGGGGVVAGDYNGGGGGAGAAAWFTANITDGQALYATIGSGGPGGATAGANGTNGTASAFMGLVAGGGNAGFGGNAGSSNAGGGGGSVTYTPPGPSAVTGYLALPGNSGMDGGRGTVGTGLGGIGVMGGGTRPQASSAYPTIASAGSGGSGSYGPGGGVGGNGANGLLMLWGL